MRATIKLLFLFLILMSNASMSGEEKKDEPKPRPSMSTIPIILTLPKGGPVFYAPSRGEEGYIIMESGSLGFELPFIDYPATVEICGEQGTSGYWTGTLTDDSDVVPFGGAAGDYRLTLTTTDGTYVGYFTID